MGLACGSSSLAGVRAQAGMVWVSRVRIADFGDGPSQGLLEQPESMLKIESAEEGLPAHINVHAGLPVRKDHSQTGFGSRSPGRWSTFRRINAPCLRG